jgi:hypothetical protein
MFFNFWFIVLLIAKAAKYCCATNLNPKTKKTFKEGLYRRVAGTFILLNKRDLVSFPGECSGGGFLVSFHLPQVHCFERCFFVVCQSGIRC